MSEMKNRIIKLKGDEASNLWMGTFHSMFARILRKECTHLKFTPAFTIYDSDDSLSAIKKVMAKLAKKTIKYREIIFLQREEDAKEFFDILEEN